MITLQSPPASLRGKVNNNNWTDAHVERLREVYASASLRGEVGLDILAVEFGRTKSAICTKARKLGLTNIARKARSAPKPPKPRKYATDAERSAARSETMRARHAVTPHPMAGKVHSQAARDKIAKASKEAWANTTTEKRSDWSVNILKARVASQGSAAPNHPHGSWKAGWREIGGKRNYYRSRWEANYARYLEWLKCRGEIQDWQHEPETFWFDKIKRGVRSYLPDFRVWENDGKSNLHEVKGWMDARSKTTLARMGRYHPKEQILVIREKDYNAIARTMRGLIEGWEISERSGRP